ncbi:MAG: tRNA (N(6)-L-threonylcarbamoyladenosine(37)-C(2))-methylthiotransferase MtaB [Deltaproteobacteria bacterium]|nr:tRNA (N(6)-L-threonylcarbamoyladenosine(37)-C(2))-methylthiotransferase MtaB [Deltaproteobacteria bacterium]
MRYSPASELRQTAGILPEIVLGSVGSASTYGEFLGRGLGRPFLPKRASPADLLKLCRLTSDARIVSMIAAKCQKAMKFSETDSRKRAAVYVLGCKVNQAEAAAMGRILEERGYLVDGTATAPDLVLVNTCCVTSRAEAKSRRMINRLARQFPCARLVVTGCLAEVDPSVVKGLSQDRLVMGAYEKDHFREFIEPTAHPVENETRTRATKSAEFGDLGPAAIPGRARAFLKIQDGCSQRCTYCIVPRARGPSRSLAEEKVVEHARSLEASGFVEIVLTGVHLGMYGRDLSPAISLERLLERLLEETSEARFRLSSMEPQEITDELLALIAARPRICRHFHIPLQSGDDAILQRMGRPYSASLMDQLVRRIHDTIPDVCIGLDVMVGFPGEDDESFRKTGRLIEDLKPAYLHVFPFSPRPGTPAASYKPRVPASIAQSRVDELRSLSANLRQAFYERFLGQTLEAVVESEADACFGLVKARTSNYIPVAVQLQALGKMPRRFSVKLEAISNGEVIGRQE